MTVAGRIADTLARAPRTVYTMLPVAGASRPVFIVGCGRSGTTILGTALSMHPSIAFLNEPRRIWRSAYPRADVWTSRASARGGQLVLTELDHEPARSARIRRAFRFEAARRRRPILVEKLPVNAFRLPFIHAVFPEARFVHIVRNGLEVARSIAEAIQRGTWLGVESYKWDRLVELAMSRQETRELPALCASSLDMGMLEWRLSTESAIAYLRSLSEDAFVELSYDELTAEPIETISRVLAFLEVGNDERVERFLADGLSRRSSKLGAEALTTKASRIGGPLLPLSIHGKLTDRAT